MNLNPNELVYGVAPAILLDCAQQIHRKARSFSFDEFCEAIGAPRSEAKLVFDQLVADGFMTLDNNAPGMYAPLMKLSQLALGNITHGIPRVDAEKLLKTVIQKAFEINANPDLHQCVVDCIVVFGSFITDKAVLGDLDIGVEVRPLISIDRPRGHAYRDLLLGTASPERKALSALRLRRPKQISTHQLNEVISMGAPYKVVFGELPEQYGSKSKR